MKPNFTPAAERALLAATRWRLFGNGADSGCPELLLGLLAESECRAAHLMLTQGIDELAVRQRWPDLERIAGEQDASVALRWFGEPIRQALDKVRRHLWDYPPVELATEHLLWGIVSANTPAGTWLAEHGLTEQAVEQDILQRRGQETAAAAAAVLDLPAPAPIPLNVGTTTPVTEPLSGEMTPSPPSEILPRSLDTRVVRSADEETLLSRGVRPGPVPVRAQGMPSEQQAILRALDASANRAREAGRVVEDYVRFVLNDRFLTEQLKSLRHELAAVCDLLPSHDRMRSRDTQGDVGTTGMNGIPAARGSLGDVATVNFARLTEALRSMEEFAKLLDPRIADRLEPLRYRSYTLERAVLTTVGALQRLETARLYVLMDGTGTTERFVQLARQLVLARVDVVQLRDKRLSDRDLLARAKLLRELTRDTETLFVVNDRPDIALLVDADGVHVGQDELSVNEVRRVIGPGRLVGVSTHEIEQARKAVLEGADYIGVGPTFPSQTKQFHRFPGLDYIRAVSREIRLPAFAIGGITIANLPQVLQTGTSRVAIGAAISNSPQPVQAVREFRKALSRGDVPSSEDIGAPISITTPGETPNLRATDQKRTMVD